MKPAGWPVDFYGAPGCYAVCFTGDDKGLEVEYVRAGCPGGESWSD